MQTVFGEVTAECLLPSGCICNWAAHKKNSVETSTILKEYELRKHLGYFLCGLNNEACESCISYVLYLNNLTAFDIPVVNIMYAARNSTCSFREQIIS